MNPGGSVKDRAARAIVLDAEQRGELQPGGTVVEGTAGNTGIGLAHVCNARGYRCVIVMPDNQSPEKYALLETLGAEVRRVKTVPYSNPNQYQKVAGRLADALPDAIWANQFDNTANRRAHFETTGPEIWEQTGGRIDAFVAASGTGGTFAGVSEYLKSRSPQGAQRAGRPARQRLYRVHPQRRRSRPPAAARSPRASASAASPPTCRMRRSTMPCTSRTPRPCSYVYRLLREEGLFLGSTSGINVAAAVRVARQLGPGHTVVTVLCDERLQVPVAAVQSRVAGAEGAAAGRRAVATT